MVMILKIEDIIEVYMFQIYHIKNKSNDVNSINLEILLAFKNSIIFSFIIDLYLYFNNKN